MKFTVLGHEGNYGVVTEAVLKIKPVPPVTTYGSIVFPDFGQGI